MNKENLEKFDDTKTKAENILIKYFREGKLYRKTAQYLSKKFFIESSDLKFYSKKELIELFNNKNRQNGNRKRKVAYVMQTLNKKRFF